MATARERLLQALTAIISQPFSEDAQSALKRLLNSYRVQAKPEENIDKSVTARDALATLLLTTWQQKNTLERKDAIQLIEPFRMQVKTSLSKRRGGLDDFGETHGAGHESSINKRTKVKENNNRHENAYFRQPLKSSVPAQDSAIAGGPLPKAGGRGECPKCHSAGIVLARAYESDDYYSCIYCGYQAYGKAQDDKMNSSLSAVILDKETTIPGIDDED